MKHDENGNAIITLSKKLDVDGKPTDTLLMREPIVADQMAAEEMAGDSRALMEVTLYANLCNVPAHVIKGMGMRDYKKLQQAYTGFTN